MRRKKQWVWNWVVESFHTHKYKLPWWKVLLARKREIIYRLIIGDGEVINLALAWDGMGPNQRQTA
jgi:hypothetical protein